MIFRELERKQSIPLQLLISLGMKHLSLDSSKLGKRDEDCKEILEMMGLPDYSAWEIVKRTNACLMEDPFWLRFSEDETFDDTTRGRARRIMAEYQKSADTN